MSAAKLIACLPARCAVPQASRYGVASSSWAPLRLLAAPFALASQNMGVGPALFFWLALYACGRQLHAKDVEEAARNKEKSGSPGGGGASRRTKSPSPRRGRRGASGGGVVAPPSPRGAEEEQPYHRVTFRGAKLAGACCMRPQLLLPRTRTTVVRCAFLLLKSHSIRHVSSSIALHAAYALLAHLAVGAPLTVVPSESGIFRTCAVAFRLLARSATATSEGPVLYYSPLLSAVAAGYWRLVRLRILRILITCLSTPRSSTCC